MKKTVAIRERIAARAYFAWQAGSTAGAEADWHEAEAIEVAHTERGLAAATKAAAPRRANTKAPAEMLVAASRKSPIRPIAH